MSISARRAAETHSLVELLLLDEAARAEEDEDEAEADDDASSELDEAAAEGAEVIVACAEPPTLVLVAKRVVDPAEEVALPTMEGDCCTTVPELADDDAALPEALCDETLPEAPCDETLADPDPDPDVAVDTGALEASSPAVVDPLGMTTGTPTSVELNSAVLEVRVETGVVELSSAAEVTMGAAVVVPERVAVAVPLLVTSGDEGTASVPEVSAEEEGDEERLPVLVGASAVDGESEVDKVMMGTTSVDEAA